MEDTTSTSNEGSNKKDRSKYTNVKVENTSNKNIEKRLEEWEFNIACLSAFFVNPEKTAGTNGAIVAPDENGMRQYNYKVIELGQPFAPLKDQPTDPEKMKNAKAKRKQDKAKRAKAAKEKMEKENKEAREAQEININAMDIEAKNVLNDEIK